MAPFSFADWTGKVSRCADLSAAWLGAIGRRAGTSIANKARPDLGGHPGLQGAPYVSLDRRHGP